MLEIGTPSHFGFRELTLGCGDTGREKSTYCYSKAPGAPGNTARAGSEGRKVASASGKVPRSSAT